MKKWWFLITALNAIFKPESVDNPEEEIEMYICAMCGSMFLDRRSYIMHYKVDSCVIDKDTMPSEPFELRLSE